MSKLYPLRFHPILRRYIWGGRRLESLGKSLGPEDDFAESWEIVDHGADQSVVAYGSLSGLELCDLVRDFGPELLGRHAPLAQFPLLFKFLDARRQLSIQVHPDDARAQLLDPPDLGKTEAWVILAAEPGSSLYAGLRAGSDRRALAGDVAAGRCESSVECITPRAGDCFFLPAGVVHALGAGLLVAEIQQASDTTYRLYDWNRPGPDGRPRPLHVDEALEVIDFNRGPVAAQKPQPTARQGVERLVECDKFILDRWTLASPAQTPDDGTCRILAVIEGAIELENDPAPRPLYRGDVALLPAELGATQVTPQGHTVVLDIRLP